MSHPVTSCAIRDPTEPAEWVQLMPLGRVVGRDGREWQLSDPQAVIAASRANGLDASYDYAPERGWLLGLQSLSGATAILDAPLLTRLDREERIAT